MALLITNTETKKIEILNAGVEIPQVYGRFDWHPDMEGKKIKTQVLFFKDKATWENYVSLRKQGKNAVLNIITDIPAGLNIEVGENEVQDCDFVHNKLIEAYSAMGYTVVKYSEEQ